MPLSNELYSGRPNAPHKEDLKVVIMQCSSQELANDQCRAKVSDETYHLHCLWKGYCLFKWVPHTLLEINKDRRVAAL